MGSSSVLTRYSKSGIRYSGWATAQCLTTKNKTELEKVQIGSSERKDYNLQEIYEVKKHWIVQTQILKYLWGAKDKICDHINISKQISTKVVHCSSAQFLEV